MKLWYDPLCQDKPFQNSVIRNKRSKEKRGKKEKLNFWKAEE